MSKLQRMAFLIAIAIFATNIAYSQTSSTVFATMVNGSPQLSISQSILIAAFEDEFNDGSVISTVTIENYASSGNPAKYWLIATGKKNDTLSRTMAVALDLSNGEFRTTDPRHSCKGNWCSECAFKRVDGGGIVGCKCEDWISLGCDHTVTTGARRGGYGVGTLP